jgi:hypothetical protein
MTGKAWCNGATRVKSPWPSAAAGEGDDAALQGDDHGRGAVVDAQLGVGVQPVGLDRGQPAQGLAQRRRGQRLRAQVPDQPPGLGQVVPGRPPGPLQVVAGRAGALGPLGQAPVGGSAGQPFG